MPELFGKKRLSEGFTAILIIILMFIIAFIAERIFL